MSYVPLWVFLLAAGGVMGGLPSNHRFILKPESRIWIEGSSSVNTFTCVAAEASNEFRGMDHMEMMGDTAMMRSMMGDPAMMRSMMGNPAMMRSMMAAMMDDTTAMRRMMTDSGMMDAMSGFMADHPNAMQAHMERMMGDPEHRQAMVELLRQHPSLGEQMRRVLDEAGMPSSSSR